jgi:membrane-associated phospholipid phosphatase
MGILHGGVRSRRIDFRVMRPTDSASNSFSLSETPRDIRWTVVAGISVFLIVVAHLADPWAWGSLRDPRVYERDWGRLLRILGFLPTWLLVAVALAVQDRGGNPQANPGWKWRGGLMILVPAATGLLAEVLKLVFRRLRPGETSPEYMFRAFSEGPFSNKGMGLPSSHEMVAMGAAIVLARLFPRVAWMWYLIAIGCGLTRVMAGAHYLSDVTVAAVAAWIVGALITRWGLGKRARAIAAAT